MGKNKDLGGVIDCLITTVLELNDRIIALEELAAEYLAQQETE